MADTPNSLPESSTPGNARLDAAVGIGADILEHVQEVLKGGKIRGVRIKLGNRTLREIPVEAAAVSAILIAAAAVVVSQLRVEIDKG